MRNTKQPWFKVSRHSQQCRWARRGRNFELRIKRCEWGSVKDMQEAPPWRGGLAQCSFMRGRIKRLSLSETTMTAVLVVPWMARWCMRNVAIDGFLGLWVTRWVRKENN